MIDYIVGAILLVTIGLAINYIRKVKKAGVHCIGCPAAGTCARQGHCNCEGNLTKKE